MNLTFDEQSHHYLLNGFPVPSVTQLIQAVMKREWDGAEFARDRGTAVHLGTSLYDAGNLDESSIDDRIWPYITSWKKFLEESKAEVIANEQQVASATYRYAGTLDRILKIGDDYVLADIKTGTVLPEVQIQLAMYEIAYKESEGKNARKISRRLAIHLDESGTYRCHWFDDKRDKQLALSFLAVAQWLKTHNPQKG